MENIMLPCAYDLPLSGLGFLDWYAPHNVFHPGVDLNKGSGNSDCNNPCYAAKAGKVEYINTSVFNGRGFGLFVILKHADGNYTRYAHLNKIANLKIGQEVKKAEQIGNVGKTGTTYCHCHFEVMNEKCAEYQRKNVYKWAYYPEGQSKEWVQEHYENPFEWMKVVPPVSDWAKESMKKAVEKGVFDEVANPQDKMTGETWAWIWFKLLFKETPVTGELSREEAAVVLDRAGLLDEAKKG